MVFPLFAELDGGVVGEDEPEEMEDEKGVQNDSKYHSQHVAHELEIEEREVSI